MNSAHTLFLFVLFSLFLACKSEQKAEAISTFSEAEADNIEEMTEPSEEMEPKVETSSFGPIQAKELLYPWVDKLNLRDKPSIEGKVVSTIQLEDALEFTGEKSDQLHSIVLRGVLYDEPWYKVIGPDKKEAWVFGGAVKKEGEIKGNPAMDEKRFNFPHFGSFDLKEWEKLSSKDESGGDAEIVTTLYKKGEQFLEISAIDVGEYGYAYTHKLLDVNKKVLKERELNFTADAEMRELYEIVKDHMVQPSKEYKRMQKMKQHYMQLNAKPLMVNGPWE